MSMFIFILIALLSMNDARLRNNRFQPHRHRGQMGFKWSTRQHTKGVNVQHYAIPLEKEQIDQNAVATEKEYTTVSSPNNEYDLNDEDVPEPTLNPETDDEASTSIPDGNAEDDHPAPIMDCLYNKCHDIFMDCFNDEQCKGFMRDWQQRQSLDYPCLSSPATNKIIHSKQMSTEDIESTDYPIDTKQDENECEYNELFWNTYHCGVDNDCYIEQLILASSQQSHQYLLSSSNYILLIVAIVSGISSVIIVEVLRRLYNGFKDKCQCECTCNGCKKCLDLFRYSSIKFGYNKYSRKHDDLTSIEEEDDNDDMLQTGNGSIGVTYNGIINDDSSISDDDEDGDIHTDNDLIVPQQQSPLKQNGDNNNNNDEEQKDNEELIEAAPTQSL